MAKVQEERRVGEGARKNRSRTGCLLGLLVLVVVGLVMFVATLGLSGLNSTKQATQEDFDSVVNMRTPDGQPAISWSEKEGDSFSMTTKTSMLGYTAYQVQARNVTIRRPIAIIIPGAAAQRLIDNGAYCVLAGEGSYMCSNTTFSGPALLFTSGTEKFMGAP